MPRLFKLYSRLRWLSIAFLFSCTTPVQSASDVVVENNPLSIYLPENSPFSVVSAFSVEARGIGFGGISGLLISKDGTNLLGISDTGRWIKTKITQDENKKPVGFGKTIDILPLKEMSGDPVARGIRDSEGLTRGKNCSEPTANSKPEGDFDCVIVSFEGRKAKIYSYSFKDKADVMSYHPPASASLPPPPRPRQNFQSNQGMESIRLLPDGRLITFFEFPLADKPEYYTGYIRQNDKAGNADWKPFYIKTDDSYGLTDIDVLPTGDLILLKRNFNVLSGWEMKLEWLKGSDIKPYTQLDAKRLLSLSSFSMIDNMEGLAIVPQPDKKNVWLYIISDDNFNRFQKTMMMVLNLPLSALPSSPESSVQKPAE